MYRHWNKKPQKMKLIATSWTTRKKIIYEIPLHRQRASGGREFLYSHQYWISIDLECSKWTLCRLSFSLQEAWAKAQPTNTPVRECTLHVCMIKLNQEKHTHVARSSYPLPLPSIAMVTLMFTQSEETVKWMDKEWVMVCGLECNSKYKSNHKSLVQCILLYNHFPRSLFWIEVSFFSNI